MFKKVNGESPRLCGGTSVLNGWDSTRTDDRLVSLWAQVAGIRSGNQRLVKAIYCPACHGHCRCTATNSRHSDGCILCSGGDQGRDTASRGAMSSRWSSVLAESSCISIAGKFQLAVSQLGPQQTKLCQQWVNSLCVSQPLRSRRSKIPGSRSKRIVFVHRPFLSPLSLEVSLPFSLPSVSDFFDFPPSTSSPPSLCLPRPPSVQSWFCCRQGRGVR